MITRFLGSFTLQLIAATFFLWSASGQTRWSSIDSSRVAWLADQVIVLDTPEGVESWVDDVTPSSVVALGEATHGDGTAFLLRSELTIALHKKAGFRALGLEALGAFDPADSLLAGSAFLWSGSTEAWPGLEYALSSSGENPLAIRGIDVQHRHHHAWWDRTETVLGQRTSTDSSWTEVRSTLTAAFSNPFAPVSQEKQDRIRKRVDELTATLRRNGHPEHSRFLDNALANVATAWEQSYDPRNRQMAANILGLVADGSNTVVWAASSHLVRSLQAIDTMTDEWSYDGAETVGGQLAATLAENYRMVAFSACQGSYGAEHIRLSQKEIEKPAEGSLEALICALPFDTAAYINLRRARTDADAGWMQVPLTAGPLGYAPKRASWPLALDGLIVMRTMQPSTPRSLP